MIAPQLVLVAERAAGIPPISTVVNPGGMIGVGGCAGGITVHLS